MYRFLRHFVIILQVNLQWEPQWGGVCLKRVWPGGEVQRVLQNGTTFSTPILRVLQNEGQHDRSPLNSGDAFKRPRQTVYCSLWSPTVQESKRNCTYSRSLALIKAGRPPTHARQHVSMVCPGDPCNQHTNSDDGDDGIQFEDTPI